MKRWVAIVMIAVLMGSFCACGKVPEKTEVPTPPKATVLIPGRIDYKMWDYVKKESGVVVTLESIPDKEFEKQLLLKKSVPEQLPDLVYLKNKHQAEVLASEKLLVKLSDYFEKLPQYERYSSVYDDDGEIGSMCHASDGDLYIAPSFDVQRLNAQKVWIVRADILKKAGIMVPTNMHELADVAVRLKKLYPNSFPLALPDGLKTLELLAPAWKKDASMRAYYDFENKKWAYGASEEWMGNFVSYWAGMYRSGILPKDYLTRNRNGWETLISGNRCFMMPDNIWRMEQLKKKYPTQDWQMMPAPCAMVESGQNKVANCDYNTAGYAICNTGDETRINNALSLLDWMYSDEAEKLLNWGVEGESYQLSEIDKKIILNKNESASNRYGIGTIGLNQRIDPQVMPYLLPMERINRIEVASLYVEAHRNPAQWIVFSEEEKKTLAYYQNRLNLVMDTVVPHFLTGARPMSEWKAFSESLENLDLDRILNAYKKAYNRAK